MTDTETALLAAIQRDPDDDTVRLAYADCLSENGDEERGEFIRLCVSSPQGQNAHRILDLIRLHPEWRPKCFTCDGTGVYVEGVRCVTCLGTGRVGEFRRGLLECVRVPTLETVLERIVKQSNQGGHVEWQPTTWVRDELATFLPYVREVWFFRPVDNSPFADMAFVMADKLRSLVAAAATPTGGPT